MRKYNLGIITSESLWGSLEGWFGHAMWANTYKLRKKSIKQIRELK